MAVKETGHTQEVNLAPYSVEAEEAVIASCLIDPEVYPKVRAIISSEDFNTITGQEVFSVIEKLWPGVDNLTVYEQLKGTIEAAYLARVVSRLPTSLNAEYYARIIRDRSYERKIISAAGEIAAKAYEGKLNAVELFNEAQNILCEIEPHSEEDILDSKAIANHMMTMVSDRLAQKKSEAITFGFIDLDKLTGGGMFPGNTVVIGARPAVGKSQLLVEIGLKARFNGLAVMIASAEMTLDEWCEREIAIQTGISVGDQRKGEPLLSDSVMAFIDTVSKHKHYWLNEPITLSRIINKARTLRYSKGLDLLIVDYIQLIADTVAREHATNIREKVGYISRSIKRLAKELNISVILAAQLNRDVESRTSKIPLMSDFREAGDIEQDADIIILLHRPSLYDPKDEPGVTRLYVPKIRQIGEIGIIDLYWKKEYHQHVNMSKIL